MPSPDVAEPFTPASWCGAAQVPPDARQLTAAFGSLDGWAAELKLDGWRALVTVTETSVQVRTRRGKDVTPAVPELSQLHLPDVVLDGELVIGAGRLSDFYGLAGRLSGEPRDGSAARAVS